MIEKLEVENPEKLIVVTVHGIRTFGEWQDRLAALIRSEAPEADVHNYQYGFFSVLAFLFPPFRAIRVWLFRRSLKRILDKNPSARITIVGHSFGTHMVGWALARRFPPPLRPIEQVILAGSVLRQNFDWERLIDEGIVRRVVNDCGTDDSVLILSQFGVLFTGMAGRIGFSGPTGVTLFNRYHPGGHSHYFLGMDGKPDNGFMQTYWLPLILAPGLPLSAVPRPTASAAVGLIQFLVQNADGFKIALIAAVAFLSWQKLYAEPREEATIERLGRLRVIALQQVGNDETVPQGVATLLAIALQNPDDRQALDVALRWLPELRDLRTQLQPRGFPTLALWSGQNLLLTGKRTVSLTGSAAKSYWFSHDRTRLMTYDSGSSINMRDASSGRLLLTIPSHGGGGYPYYDRDETGNFREPVPLQPFKGEIGSMNFGESADGRTIFGIGTSAEPLVGDQRPILLLVDRMNLAFSLCVFPAYRLRLVPDRNGIHAFAANQREEFFEIAAPKPGKACAYLSTDASGAPVSLLSDLAARVAQAPDMEESSLAAADPALEFPALRAANASWSTHPLLQGADSLGFGFGTGVRGTRPLSDREAEAQRQTLIAYAQRHRGVSADEIEIAVGENGIGRSILVSDSGDSLISVIEGGGISYRTTTFCLSRKLDDQIQYCDGINAHGNFHSFAVSRDNRYVAGGDLAAFGRPGMTIFDVRRHKALVLSRQPEGGTNAVAFDTSGNWAFAATPYGVWAYALHSDGRAQLKRIFKISGLLANRHGSEIVSSITASNEHLFYLSDGLLQAISRSTGDVDWLERLPMSDGSLVYDAQSDQLAVNDERCVHLHHGATGARVMQPLCTTQPGATDFAPSAEIEGSISGVRFNSHHKLELWTNAGVYRRDREEPLHRPKPISRSWLHRLAVWLGSDRAQATNENMQEWTMRTGHDVRFLPAQPVRRLEITSKAI